VNVIAPPLALDGPTLTIRKFKKDKLKLQNLVEFGSISPEGARILEIIGACRCQRADFWRHRFGQDDAAQLSDGLYRRRRAHHHL
jgi:type IV secretory pathway ATPase VirB11/archaellum biosynthesis ATPase